MIKTFEEARYLVRELPRYSKVFIMCCGRRPRRTTFSAFLDLVMGNGNLAPVQTPMALGLAFLLRVNAGWETAVSAPFVKLSF
jgi:hypothetical protein